MCKFIGESVEGFGQIVFMGRDCKEGTGRLESVQIKNKLASKILLAGRLSPVITKNFASAYFVRPT